MEERVFKLIEKHKNDKDLTSEKDYIKPGWDWSGSNLIGWNLSKLSLSTHENPSNFKSANLYEANLKEAKFSFANLDGADLTIAQLEGADLTGALFKNANLINVHLKGAHLVWANFDGCSMVSSNLEGANLCMSQLNGSRLELSNFEGACLSISQLNYADLSNTNLKFVDLQGAQLEGSNLSNTTLKGANLSGTQLEGVNLTHTDLRDSIINEYTNFKDVNFFQSRLDNSTLFNAYKNIDQIVIEERGDDKNPSDFEKAQNVYRLFKKYFSQEGMYDIAGRYYYREMLMTGKIAFGDRKFIPKHLLKYLGNYFLRITTGYGERWWYVLFWWLGIVFYFGIIYWSKGVINCAKGFWQNIYFSCVTFTTLGFGDYWPKPGPFQLLVAFEAFIGSFFMALFIFVFVRKLTR